MRGGQELALGEALLGVSEVCEEITEFQLREAVGNLFAYGMSRSHVSILRSLVAVQYRHPVALVSVCRAPSYATAGYPDHSCHLPGRSLPARVGVCNVW